MNNMVSFQRILAEMQEHMQETLKLFIGFWKDLQNESPNFQYLGNTSNEISEKAVKIRADYRNLISMNPSNIYCRMLYALFLKKVMKDEFEAYDIHEEYFYKILGIFYYRTAQTQNSNKLRSSYGGNDWQGDANKAALFIISGNKSNIGEILCINNEVTEILGYEKNDLVSHNISHIMPPAIGRKHTEIILKSFNCAVSQGKRAAFMVLPLHKHGYLVVCTIVHRVVPELSQEVQIIGFVKKIADLEDFFPALEKGSNPDDIAILLVDDQWRIHTFNVKALRVFGIEATKANLRKYINSDELLDIKRIIPQFEVEHEFAAMKVNYQSNVLVMPEVFRKQIDVEMDFSNYHGSSPKLPTENDNNYETSLFSPNDYQVSSATDLACRCTMHYQDVIYGKYDSDKPEIEMKLIVLIENQPAVERVSKNTEQDNENIPSFKAKFKYFFYYFIKNSKENQLLIDDITSQSSSASHCTFFHLYE